MFLPLVPHAADLHVLVAVALFWSGFLQVTFHLPQVFYLRLQSLNLNTQVTYDVPIIHCSPLTVFRMDFDKSLQHLFSTTPVFLSLI